MLPFALWITGRPVAGKSTVAGLLATRLRTELSNPVVVLESDVFRDLVLGGRSGYSRDERDWFYGVLVRLGRVLTGQHVNVLYDATGQRRAYRNAARRACRRFAEVYVECPIQVCISRDTKGLYARARAGQIKSLPIRILAQSGPGSNELDWIANNIPEQEVYEPPTRPAVRVDSSSMSPKESVEIILRWLQRRHWV